MGDNEDDGRWQNLGSNAVRENAERTISIPNTVAELVFDGPDEEDDGYAHWAFEERHGWIILSDRELRGEFEEIDRVKRYKLREDGRTRIPDRLFNPAENPNETTDQVVPSHVAMDPGEQRFFFTWTEWAAEGPNAVILITLDDLDFSSPSELGGLGGDSGPRFGGGSIDLPDPYFDLDPDGSED